MVRTNRMRIGRTKANIQRCAVMDKSFGSQQKLFKSTNKLLYLLDTKHQTFESQ